MATQPIKTRFELDGEQEYKAAVSEINASLRVLNSEMKLVSAQFATNADSVDALTARSDVLTRQILTQKEKVEALQAALKDSADRYGEADDRTKRWQTTLNNAEAELAKMEQQLQTALAADSNCMPGWKHRLHNSINWRIYTIVFRINETALSQYRITEHGIL